ncbi:MAG: GspE/PulE/PilB domain-containing protein [Myxococcales bacterium]
MGLDLGTLLLQKNLISQAQFREARDVQMQRGGEVGRICVDMGFLDERRLASTLAQALGLTKVDLGKVAPDPAAVEKIPRRLAANLWAFPYGLKDGARTLWIAMANPLDEAAKQALQRAAGCALHVTVAGYREIERAIEAYLGEGAGDSVDFDEGDDGGPVKITDLAGHTMVTMAPEPKAKPPPVAAPAASPGPGPLTEEERRLILMLQEGLTKSGAALQAVLELCVERGLFTKQQVVAKLGRR